MEEEKAKVIICTFGITENELENFEKKLVRGIRKKHRSGNGEGVELHLLFVTTKEVKSYGMGPEKYVKITSSDPFLSADFLMEVIKSFDKKIGILEEVEGT